MGSVPHSSNGVKPPQPISARPVIDCYVRNSTALQVDNWRAEYQKAELPRIVREQGYEPQVWEEQGQSGETLESRQKMLAILDRVRSKQSIGIATVDFGRLSRDIDMIDGLRIWETCKRAGAIIITPGKVWRPGTAQDDDFAFITFWYESRNKRDIVTKLFQGLMKRAEAAPMFRGHPMYGYDPVIVDYQQGARTRKTIDWKVNLDEAAIVREIANLYLSQGHTGIRDYLNERAKSDPRYAWKFKQHRKGLSDEGVGWRPQTIQRILHHPIYRGLVPVFRERNSSLAQLVPFKTHYRPDLQIISDDLANAVDAVSASRKFGAGGRVEPSSPYNKLLKCPHCGWYLILHIHPPSETDRIRTTNYTYYQCRQRLEYGKERCPGCRLSGEAIHEALVPLVQEQVDRLTQAELAARAAALLSGTDEQLKALRSEEEALRKGIADYNRDYYVSKKLPIPEAVFLETMAAWSAQLVDIQKRIRDMEAQKREAAGPDVLPLIEELKTNLGEVLADQPATVQNTILRALFQEIVLERDTKVLPRGTGYRYSARVVSFEPVYQCDVANHSS